MLARSVSEIRAAAYETRNLDQVRQLMFLLSPDRDRNEGAVRDLVDALPLVPSQEVRSYQCGAYWLTWHPSKSWERLRRFDDGFLIGSLELATQSVGQSAQDWDPRRRQANPLPADEHPLAEGLKIAIDGENVRIEPLNYTNVFAGKGAVSDRQLLIARISQTLPSPKRVAVLSAVGYLPGNITLFEGIERIPYLHAYSTREKDIRQLREYPSDAAPDDDSLVERLVELVPRYPLQYLGMSGGYDSRFVLGVLMQAGVRPTLVHRADVETPVVRDIARQLDLELLLIEEDAPLLPADVYTLATDAQLYFRGGNYSTVRTHIDCNSLYHTGLFADAVIKNAFKTAAKLPGGIGRIHRRLVDHALLSTTPRELQGLRTFKRRNEIAEYLMGELQFGRGYYDFRSKKEWANWYYFLHRGVRWTPATTADLSYFTQPLFILSDLKALAHGISSSMWDNFKKDRVRSLCEKLLPDLNVPFEDGKKTSANRFVNGWEKLKYEYVERLLVSRRRHSSWGIGRANSTDDVPYFIEPAESYSIYFSEGIERLLRTEGRSRSLKRSAVTLHYTLQFIESGSTTFVRNQAVQESRPA